MAKFLTEEKKIKIEYLWTPKDFVEVEKELNATIPPDDYVREWGMRLAREMKYLENRHAIKVKDVLGHPTEFVIPENYRVEDDKLQKYHEWKARKEYGKRMAEREYDG